MSGKPPEHHFARAAERHYRDALYLHQDGRLANADHHFGIAVECALKSLLIRFTAVSMRPRQASAKPATMPWAQDPVTGKVHTYSHLPWVATDVSLLTHGRSATRLGAALGQLSAFDSWSVHDRYLDASDVVVQDVARRRTVAGEIISVHEHALITGRSP
ncbi:HEPN domain-containing protein [Streptomyces marincola]|uniref:hypothetical protein n=1 Tax=Streptomyces marincola TaxID=2878388 RepID=UPI001CF24D96|nr:hypothetical protein [Streptomyces marincola]UCM90630.1 hypothetical protein LC193_23305 [Streptomyces marincola]